MDASEDWSHDVDNVNDVFLNLNLLTLPTPPLDDDKLFNKLDVSPSSTFHPQAELHALAPDLILVSSEGVAFHVHSHLLGASDNGFCALLPIPALHKDSLLRINESSCLLDIVLRSIYDLPVDDVSITFPTLVAAVNRLPVYGISPKFYITPSSSLFALLISFAPQFPLELYALAASHDIYDLAVSASMHLLSFDLASLTDNMATLIGSFYLKRLFFLHAGRLDALKRILLPPPSPHLPTPECDPDQQNDLTRAWALASAYIAWDARPDLTTSAMESALQTLNQRFSCDRCQRALRNRIRLLVTQWSEIKKTI